MEKENKEEKKARKKQYDKEYNSQPNIKEKIKQYLLDNKEKIKARAKEYNSQPEIKARNKQYRLDNKEKISARMKQYSSHPEVKQQLKQYRLNNKEKIKQQRKEYKLDNKEEIKAKGKQYYSDNQEKIKARVNQYRKESRERVMKYHKEYRQGNREKINAQARQYRSRPEVKQYHEEMNKIENFRRKKLGLALIGEGFRREMELKVYIHHLFMDYDIFTHHRKPLMEWKPAGLELDIYIPELKLAFEYNGQQHYERIPFFHKTEEEFEAQQYRDRCKKKICKLKGITLIRIKYDEKLSEQLILKKINYFPCLTQQRRIF